MELDAIPDRLSVRFTENDRTALKIIAKAMTTPHRPPLNVTDALRAAISIAAQAVAEAPPTGI